MKIVLGVALWVAHIVWGVMVPFDEFTPAKDLGDKIAATFGQHPHAIDNLYRRADPHDSKDVEGICHDSRFWTR